MGWDKQWAELAAVQKDHCWYCRLLPLLNGILILSLTCHRLDEITKRLYKDGKRLVEANAGKPPILFNVLKSLTLSALAVL